MTTSPSPVAVRDSKGLASLQEDDALFERLLDAAEARSSTGRWASALEWAGLAVKFAAARPTLRLRSARLERLFDEIALATLAEGTVRARREGPRRVLHVVGDTPPVGGSTRLPERWMRLDTASESTVVSTEEAEILGPLVDAAITSGGAAVAFPLDADLFVRARRLRELAADADLVVSHAGLDDPVVAIAFGAGYRGAPVAIFNHGDHLFGAAPTSAAVFVDSRSAAAAVSRHARGYSEDSMFTLPVAAPELPEDSDGGDDVRASLGIGADATLAVAVARAVKFQETAIGPAFAELVGAALEASSTLVVCAVGASPAEAPWPDLAARFPGRVHAVGAVMDPRAYLGAADLFLDTFPFGSLTSLFEASAAGLPVIVYDGHSGLRRVLGVAEFVLTPEDRPTSVSAYARRIAELAADPAVRRSSGERSRAMFDELARQDVWLDRMEELYRSLSERADGARPIGRSPVPEPDEAIVDLNVAVLAIQRRAPLLWIMRDGVARFDEADRRALRPRVFIARAGQALARGLSLEPPGFHDLILSAATRSRAGVDR